MDLHRTSGRPDWELRDKSDYTLFQKVASSTRGILTPANIITTTGLSLVLYGLLAILDEKFLLGLAFLATGRVMDVADGAIAQLTNTKSPLGEFYDAAVDKLSTVLTVVVLFVANITDWWVLFALALPQIIIPLAVFCKRRRGVRIHPTRAGKLSMAAVWAGIAGLLVLAEIRDIWPLAVVIYTLIGISVALGLYAFWQYAAEQD